LKSNKKANRIFFKYNQNQEEKSKQFILTTNLFYDDKVSLNLLILR